MQDLPIAFDNNGDGTSDQSLTGLSSFLGLNDMFTTEDQAWQWDTPVLTSSYTLPSSLTLKFSTGTDGLDVDGVVLQSGMSLQEIADRINGRTALEGKVTAKVVDEGRGQRLRITSDDGSELAVSLTNGLSSTLESLGLAPSSAGASRALDVTSSLTEDPSRIATGVMQYDDNTGKYYLSAGDNTNANAMADAFASPRSYNTAGGLSTAQLSLSDYGASIVSSASSRASSNEAALEYQNGLTEALALKNAETSDVNLDEELAQLMVFEQSYAAAAKIISTTQQMFDVLNGIIR